MSNIILPSWQSVVNAMNDGDGSLILDHNLRPISSRDMPKPRTPGQTVSFEVGKDIQYFKIRSGVNSDKWMIGKVKGKPIPPKAEAINTRKAFEMMYGEALTNSKGNKNEWKKISRQEYGEVIVEYPEPVYQNLPNHNL